MSSIDGQLLRRSLADTSTSIIDDLECFASIGSTNSHLLAATPPPAGRVNIALADEQTAGRGRQNRRWLSPPGAGLCLSLVYTFARRPGDLSSLTLASGVGIVNALSELGVNDLRLKWPNDIVAGDAKLGGVLTEVRAGGGPGVTVVTGVGINLALPAGFDAGSDSAWAQRPADLQTLLPDPPAREIVAAKLIDHLCLTMSAFAERGFAGFAEAWRQFDWLQGRQIAVDTAARELRGIAAGVDATGALLVDADGGRVRVLSGTIAAVGVGAGA